jgi:predicted transcriptional regulator
MPTVTLKTDDRLYKQIMLMADELHVTKSEVIRQAVAAYSENLERNKIKLIMQAASFKVRGEDKDLMDELDSLASDGLNDA